MHLKNNVKKPLLMASNCYGAVCSGVVHASFSLELCSKLLLRLINCPSYKMTDCFLFFLCDHEQLYICILLRVLHPLSATIKSRLSAGAFPKALQVSCHLSWMGMCINLFLAINNVIYVIFL